MAIGIRAGLGRLFLALRPESTKKPRAEAPFAEARGSSLTERDGASPFESAFLVTPREPLICGVSCLSLV